MKKIVGIEDATYIKDGKAVVGTRLYFTDDTPSSNLTGIKCDSVYISNQPVLNFRIDEVLTFTFEVSHSGYAKCTGVVYVSDVAQPASSDSKK